MFLPPKLKAIAITTSLISVLFSFSQSVEAQDAEFNRRLAAMQQARQRASQPAEVRVAAAPMVQPPAETTVRTASAQMLSAPTMQSAPPMTDRVAAAPRIRGRFVPRHARNQVMDGTIIDGGAPVIGSQVMMGSPAMDGSLMGSTIVDGQVLSQPYADGSYIDNGVMVDDGCSTCGDAGGYFEDDCCGRGGCPPGQPCWISGLGGILRNSEFFSGFTSFRSTFFNDPTTAGNDLFDDCSHGYYGGFNAGIPLCRLTCGVFSGQFGLRTVNTNFNGNAFTNDDRNQLFFTAGFYRRVDYGIQLGVVADVLREEWYSGVDLVQIRGDIGYVWPSGTTFGFKFATNVQDDVASGVFNGLAFTGQRVTTDDNYRFYLRHDAAAGGWGEIFAGWSNLNQGIIGLDFDMPITDRIAVEAGFTYYLNDDGVPANQGFLGGNASQAYNTYIGLAFRPRGRSWYKNYDRPLFDVADNGSMLTRR